MSNIEHQEQFNDEAYLTVDTSGSSLYDSLSFSNDGELPTDIEQLPSSILQEQLIIEQKILASHYGIKLEEEQQDRKGNDVNEASSSSLESCISEQEQEELFYEYQKNISSNEFNFGSERSNGSSGSQYGTEKKNSATPKPSRRKRVTIEEMERGLW